MRKRFTKVFLSLFAFISVIAVTKLPVKADLAYPVVTWEPDGEEIDTKTWQYEEGDTISGLLWISPGYASSQRIFIEIWKKSGSYYSIINTGTFPVSSSSTAYFRRMNVPADMLSGVGLYRIVLIGQNYNQYSGKWEDSIRRETYNFKIVKKIVPTSVKLDRTRMGMTWLEKETLKATVLPAGASQKVTWKSSNTKVATVDSDGTVKAQSEGTAVITATTSNNLSASCTVTVLSTKQVQLIEDFVTRLYRLCFGREPDAGGLKNWTDQLVSQKKTAAQVVSGFFNSTEFKNLKLNNEDYVERCYQVLMNRASDAGGKKSWLEKLEVGVSNTYMS